MVDGLTVWEVPPSRVIVPLLFIVVADKLYPPRLRVPLLVNESRELGRPPVKLTEPLRIVAVSPDAEPG
jgi:hypothetical protein